jgi:hypothetical protein
MNVVPGYVLTETMALTNERTGITSMEAIPAAIPAAAIVYLCVCDDPWPYAGLVVDGPQLAADLHLV